MAVELQRPVASITSYGGVDGIVSGSCHVFESGPNGKFKYKVVIDCGILQGKGDLANFRTIIKDYDEMTDDIWKNTQAAALTHDHADHSHGIPNAIKNGYTLNFYTTEPTKRIIQQTLPRSATIHDKGDSVGSFYGLDDVKRTLAYIKTVEPFKEIPITRDKNISATFCLNGHTPGSSSILLKDKWSGKNVLFTGDIGRPNQLLTGGYESFASKYPQDPVNVLMVESTCYPNSPISFEKRISSFQKEILSAFGRGGSILMPCIKHRYMEITEIIHNMQKEGKLPKDIKFFRDGPSLDMIYDIYQGLGVDYFSRGYGDNPDYYQTRPEKQARFNLNNFSRIVEHQDSLNFVETLNNNAEKVIIFTSGGMGEAGRVCNYFESDFVRNPKNTVIFSCFQVPGTVGANLLKEQNRPGYRGAKIVLLEGGSSHATGGNEIFGFIERFNLEDLETVFIGHGSETSIKSMEVGIRQTDFGEYVNIILPKIGQRVDLI